MVRYRIAVGTRAGVRGKTAESAGAAGAAVAACISIEETSESAGVAVSD